MKYCRRLLDWLVFAHRAVRDRRGLRVKRAGKSWTMASKVFAFQLCGGGSGLENRSLI